MKKFLFLLAILAAQSPVFCQTLPSAASQSTIKGVNLPVNKYNGTASVSVPIYTVPLLNGGGIPVGLNYTTSGIKVNEKSGPVGLGWQLIAGGRITRIMMGHPDEETPINTSKTFNNLSAALLGHQDTEKDIFYFEFPGGGGRFIFGHGFNTLNLPKDTDDFYTLPESDLKIDFHIESTLNSYFTITDTYGNRYIFGDSPDAREKTITEQSQVNETAYDPALKEEYISTWHLTTIDHAGLDDLENTTFTYGIDGQSTVEEEGSETQFIALGNYQEGISPLYDSWERLPGGNFWEGEWVTEIRYDETATRSVVDVKRLTEITTSKAKLKFGYQDRHDMEGAMKLNYVKLLDLSGAEVSTTTFGYATSFATSSYHFDINYPETPSSELVNRMMLKSVKKDGITIRSFNYKHEESDETNNWFQLPPRGSYYTDHWGYNNSGPHHRAYVPFPSAIEEDYNQQGGVATFALAGMDKSSSASAKANILTEVHYPSGGYTKFRYGIHPNGGGVRVYRIESFNEYDVRVSGTEYNYYDHDPSNFVAGPPPAYIRYIERVSYSEDRFVVFPQAESLVYDLNGSPHGYRKVMQSNLLTGSSVIHHYKADFGEVDVNPVKSRFTLNMLNGIISTEEISSTPYQSPYSSYDLKIYDRGAEIKTEIFDEGGILVSETIYDYEHTERATLFTGLAVEKLKTDRYELFTFSADKHVIFTSEYEIEVRAPQLKGRSIISYDDGGEVTSVTEFLYNKNYKTLPLMTSTELSSGHKSVNYISYPFDDLNLVSDQFEDVSVLNLMKDMNMIGIPVLERNLIKYPGDYIFKEASAQLTTFKSFDGQILPHKSYSLALDEPGTFDSNDLVLINTNDFYPNGQLKSQEGRSGIRQLYNYDSNGNLSSLVADNGAGDTQTTSYAYKKLVGISSMTGPDGRSSSFEYDELNRLSLVKDQDGNIVKRYRYNYAGDADDSFNDISANLVIGHPRIINESISFSAQDIQMFGQGSFQWSIGGDLKEPGTTANHTFSSAGSYPYSFEIENPEYDNSKVYDNFITIYDDYWRLNPIAGPSQACTYPDGAIDYSHEMVIEDLEYSISHQSGAFDCAGGLPLEYIWTYDAGSGEVPFGTGMQATLPNDDNDIRGASGNVVIKVKASDNCGMEQFITKTLTIRSWDSSCGGGSNDGDGNGNGGGSTNPWSVKINENADQSICPNSNEPSSVTLSSQITEGDHDCGTVSYTYTWEYEVNGQTYSLGGGSNKTITRSELLTNGSTNDTYSIILTVSDGCGDSKTDQINLTFKLNC